MVGKQHQRLRLQFLADQRQLIQWLPQRQHTHRPFVAAQQESGHPQLQLMAMPGNRHQQYPLLCRITRQLQALQYPRAQKTVEEQPLAGLAELLAAQQQVLPDRQEDIGKHHGQRIGGEHLAVQAFQLQLIKTRQGQADLCLPLAPLALGQGLIRLDDWRLGCLVLGENLAHLADRHAPLDPREDAAYRLDIRLRVKTMTAVGAGRLNQPITTLPGPQGHRIDAGQARHFTNRKQLFLLEGSGKRGSTGDVVHSVARQVRERPALYPRGKPAYIVPRLYNSQIQHKPPHITLEHSCTGP